MQCFTHRALRSLNVDLLRRQGCIALREMWRGRERMARRSLALLTAALLLLSPGGGVCFPTASIAVPRIRAFSGTLHTRARGAPERAASFVVMATARQGKTPQQSKRRAALGRICALILCTGAGCSTAMDPVAAVEPQAALARGSIKVRAGATAPSSGAVFVTARLAGAVKGFSPSRDLSPIASVKIPVCRYVQCVRILRRSNNAISHEHTHLQVSDSTSAPLAFELTLENLTPEGMDSGGTWWAGRLCTADACPERERDTSLRSLRLHDFLAHFFFAYANRKGPRAVSALG